MKILWLSHFPPLPSQTDALKRKFDITEQDIVHDREPFRDAEEIVTRFRRGGYNELIFFSSKTVIGRLCELGVHPYYPLMERVMAKDSDRADLVVGRRPDQRFFRFVKFARVDEVVMRFVEGDEFE